MYVLNLAINSEQQGSRTLANDCKIWPLYSGTSYRLFVHPSSAENAKHLAVVRAVVARLADVVLPVADTDGLVEEKTRLAVHH